MSDQHNASVMGCGGHPIVQTPNTDAIAATGLRFANAYCPCPLCVPARAGFMAGQYPSDIDIYDNGGTRFFTPQTPTFPHGLGAAGYEAVLCGRMHFGEVDQFHGFEKRIHGDAGGLYTREIQGEGYYRTNGQTKYAVEVSGYGRTGAQAFDESVTNTACEYLSSRGAADRPLALVVGLCLPHNPLICSKDLFDLYMSKIDPPESTPQSCLDELHPAVRKWRERRGVDDLTPEQNRRGMAAYYGLVTELDRNIGRILEAIRNSAIRENTVVIYTSDHGDMAHEHGMWWKSSFYDGSSRVPLIVTWPGRYRVGETEQAVVSLIDVGPTILDIAGAPLLPDVSGRSFKGFLTGSGVAGWPNEVYCEYSGLHGDRPGCMIRSGPWKVNYYSEFDSCQLFNMDDDPGERHDLAGEPEYRQIIDDYRQKILGRWSAEKVREALSRQERTRAYIESSGHPLLPHVPPSYVAPDGSNEFDFAQLPKKPSWTPNA